MLYPVLLYTGTAMACEDNESGWIILRLQKVMHMAMLSHGVGSRAVMKSDQHARWEFINLTIPLLWNFNGISVVSLM